MGEVTSDTVRAAVRLLQALGETIREVGEVPAGVLYAPLCGQMSAEAFNRTIDVLVRAGVVSRSGDVLRWVGPAAVSAVRS